MSLSILTPLKESSDLVKIDQYPDNPIEFFRNVLNWVKSDLITMNLATLDSEFGVLNRTVVYRGLTKDNAIIFVTGRNTRKYKNLQENHKIALTLYFPEVQPNGQSGNTEAWQVSLLDATAQELEDEVLKELWKEESLIAKIRSHICDCGAPVDYDKLKQQHDQLLLDYKNGVNSLPQTAVYTAFSITANRWDFHKSESQKIADRVQYRKKLPKAIDESWEVFHVAA